MVVMISSEPVKGTVYPREYYGDVVVLREKGAFAAIFDLDLCLYNYADFDFLTRFPFDEDDDASFNDALRTALDHMYNSVPSDLEYKPLIRRVAASLYNSISR